MAGANRIFIERGRILRSKRSGMQIGQVVGAAGKAIVQIVDGQI